jgi:16S rRNA (cytosine967-C5)-methyltransferase
MRSHSYLNSAKVILEQYKGDIPLAAWLKTYFAANKRFGSKDRKQVANLCYSYYRLGNAFKNKEIEERLLLGLFLSSQVSSFVLQEQKPEWNAIIERSPAEKLRYLNAGDELPQVFRWQEELSKEIESIPFNLSFFNQPSLYLRIRPGKKPYVEEQLTSAGVPYTMKSATCMIVENGVKLENVLSIDKDVVIQDYSSQQVINSLKGLRKENESFTAWDCCAASGGKSILLKDVYPKVQLTTSDVRQSILHNLRSRFERAGIASYNSFVADLYASNFESGRKYDLVLCDAPCTGSGTWSRTPEQLFFFTAERISYYADLQKRIALNAIKAVKKGGYFLYITCSVFVEENEEMVAIIEKESGLQLIEATYHKGYDQKADTLFSALFQLR